MHYSKLACAFALTAAAIAAPQSGNTDSTGGTTLLSDVIQAGSTDNGINEIGSEAGEAASTTSTNNFINFCSGQTLTNGLQNTAGSCNGIRKSHHCLFTHQFVPNEQ